MVEQSQAHVRLMAYLTAQAAEGNQLIIYWDAGGDETPIWIRKRTHRGETQADIDVELFAQLRQRVAEKLSLPNAGEIYNRGSGVLHLEPSGEISIEVNALEHELNDRYHWDLGIDSNATGRLVRDTQRRTGASLRSKVQHEMHIDHHHCVENLFHRADIRLIGEMDATLHTRTRLHIEIIHGDEARVTPEAQAYYCALALDVLKECRALFDESPQPAGIYVESRLVPGNRARFNIVTDAFSQLAILDGVSVQLGRLT